jgi:hypothetical protein
MKMAKANLASMSVVSLLKLRDGGISGIETLAILEGLKEPGLSWRG